MSTAYHIVCFARSSLPAPIFWAQIAETEAEIAALEQQQTEIEQMLDLPENQTQELFRRYESVKHLIEQKMYEWELLND